MPELTLVPGGAPEHRGRPGEVPREPLLRHVVGQVLRDERTQQGRTLADVAQDARVSLPYLSEVERGRKEPSSEVLAAICAALDLTISDLLQRSALLVSPVPVSRPTTGPATTAVRPGVRLSVAA